MLKNVDQARYDEMRIHRTKFLGRVPTEAELEDYIVNYEGVWWEIKEYKRILGELRKEGTEGNA